MNACLRQLLCWGVLLLAVCIARAQEGTGTEKVTPPPPGVEKYYWDLAKSNDRVLRSMAERYVGLVKTQEWSDLSGKNKTIAHYVKHDPQLTTVTIRIMRGRGTERTSEDKAVQVDKLSKSCQSRVRQIDIAQKKIKELATKLAEEGDSTVPGASGEGPGAPMVDERGAEPVAAGPEGVAAGPGAPPAAEPAPDPSELEPDPLGFAEIPLAPPAGGEPGEVPPESAPPTPGQK